MTQPPAGISGKKLTLVVVILMVIVGGILAYTLQVYSQIDAARLQSSAVWRDVAELLDERYREQELAIARGVDDESIKMEFGERFRLAVDRFRTTANPATQQLAADEIEHLLASEGINGLPQPLPEEDLLQNVTLLNERRSSILRLLGSPGGRILDIFLELSPPPPFDLHAPAT